MRLRDLNAYFVGRYRIEDGHVVYSILDSIDGAQGISFQCPVCAVGRERGEEDGRRFVRGAHGVICWFRNPRNAAPVPSDATPGPGRWWIAASSSSIDNLTFEHGEPPIPKSIQLTSGCRWHGYVENGAATPPAGDFLSLTLPPGTLMEDQNNAAATEPSAAPDPSIAGAIAPAAPAAEDPAVDPTIAAEAPGVSADLSAASIAAPPPVDNDHIAPGSERFAAPAAGEDLEDEEDPIVEVEAIAPGYDGLRPRDVGARFPVRRSLVGSWMKVVE
jgi:hypothetical protein